MMRQPSDSRVFPARGCRRCRPLHPAASVLRGSKLVQHFSQGNLICPSPHIWSAGSVRSPVLILAPDGSCLVLALVAMRWLTINSVFTS